ncbi:cupin domain-containing protein [Methanothrix harundinacea]|jgi:quercetin dioxygenase-like cupin family protein|uniref:Cupin 2 conserved barrel domain protein n=1 Tax=Methanothrix harundinacea (strain 6Ac) TaxID=1110509 RepID=G7WNY4_METH6|nr:cupin domain-containing protein [Methanothrix harundinacea]AET64825.1 Cupin 2 conserved barrel domain protein [Methanothrix harundinacea 6Ac]
MFYKGEDEGYRQPLAGISQKTLVYGKESLLTEFRLSRGSHLPQHSHPQEQTGYMVSGRMLLSIGSEEFEAERGDSWCIPGGVEHGALILEDSVAVEIFSPIRTDYIP